MKNLVIRTVFALVLLLMLGASFGEVNPALAHAAVVHSAAHATSITPNVNRVDCGSTNEFFEVIADNGGNTDCFANAGTLGVTIYNVGVVCSGNNHGFVVWHDDGQPDQTTSFTSIYECLWISGVAHVYVNQLTVVRIY